MQNNEIPYLISCRKLKPEYNKLEKIPINLTNFSIGRGLKNSAVLPFLSKSRHHCNITQTYYDRWIFEDKSQFGIEINGVKLGNGKTTILKHRDVITLEPSKEFVYSFINPVKRLIDPDTTSEEHNKRIKIDNRVVADSGTSQIIKDVKMKFDHSQSSEIQHIAEKIQNAKQMQKSSTILKDHLQAEMTRKMQTLENSYKTKIKSLEGGKSAVKEQTALLIEERDKELASVKNEMERKICRLMEEIEKHNVTESKLILENNQLKERLLKEREEFLAKFTRESSSKQDLLADLEAKIRKQEETRLEEKKILEETLRIETEKLMEAKDKAVKEVENQNKSRETELLYAMDYLKKNLQTKMKETEQHKSKVEQMLNNQDEQIKRVREEEQFKVQQLELEREELERKLVEARLEANKSIVELETRVHDRETELAALAADRIQKNVDQSNEVINSLLQQLDKIKSDLRQVESEREMLKAANESGESSAKQSTVAEFADIMENELQCSICAELFVNATTLNCSHTFCKYCITMWKRKKPDCPICRTAITSECKSLVLDSFIEKMVDNLSADMKQKRLNFLQTRKELESHQTLLAGSDVNCSSSSNGTIHHATYTFRRVARSGSGYIFQEDVVYSSESSNSQASEGEWSEGEWSDGSFSFSDLRSDSSGAVSVSSPATDHSN